MAKDEYAKIVSKNLKRIAYEHHKTQADIARDLKLNPGTVSTWMLGTRVPRMKKIDMLCDYFNCSRDEIMSADPTSHRELVSNDELELLRMFRSLNDMGRTAALSALAGLQDAFKKSADDSSKVG